MIKEFKEFMMRGNVLDLAVGVVIGSAFTAIVTKIVEGFITPLISLIVVMITNQKDMDTALKVLDIRIQGVEFKFSEVISAIITFLITGLVLFIIVKAVNHAKSRKQAEEAEDIPVDTVETYLSDIRDLLASQADNKHD